MSLDREKVGNMIRLINAWIQFKNGVAKDFQARAMFYAAEPALGDLLAKIRSDPAFKEVQHIPLGDFLAIMGEIVPLNGAGLVKTRVGLKLLLAQDDEIRKAAKSGQV